VAKIKSNTKIGGILQKDNLTEKIIGAAIEVHRILGPGLLESIYEEALCYEFDLRGINYDRQIEIDMDYKGHALKGQRLDLLVEKEVIVEVKSVRSLPDIALAQTLSYLKAAKLKRALLINFGEKILTRGIKRISL
jgi:GxxExxY protein